MTREVNNNPVRELLDRLLGRPGDVQDSATPTMIRVITGVPSSEDEDED